jgi:hypothetical protein
VPGVLAGVGLKWYYHVVRTGCMDWHVRG